MPSFPYLCLGAVSPHPHSFLSFSNDCNEFPTPGIPPCKVRGLTHLSQKSPCCRTYSPVCQHAFVRGRVGGAKLSTTTFHLCCPSLGSGYVSSFVSLEPARLHHFQVPIDHGETAFNMEPTSAIMLFLAAFMAAPHYCRQSHTYVVHPNPWSQFESN